MSISQYNIEFHESQRETSLLTALSTLYYLARQEPLSFAIQYSETRKALGYGISAFKAIYTAYMKQAGAK